LGTTALREKLYAENAGNVTISRNYVPKEVFEELVYHLEINSGDISRKIFSSHF
jgi:hypothetical protein